MRLYDELFKNADGVGGARCVIVPLGGGYFEGVKAVGELSPTRILLYFQNTEILVLGERLTVEKYCDGDLQIRGNIHCVRAPSATVEEE